MEFFEFDNSFIGGGTNDQQTTSLKSGDIPSYDWGYHWMTCNEVQAFKNHNARISANTTGGKPEFQYCADMPYQVKSGFGNAMPNTGKRVDLGTTDTGASNKFSGSVIKKFK